jgi:hypothetical protein
VEPKTQSFQPAKTASGVGTMPAMSGWLAAICQKTSTAAGTSSPSIMNFKRRMVFNA